MPFTIDYEGDAVRAITAASQGSPSLRVKPSRGLIALSPRHLASIRSTKLAAYAALRDFPPEGWRTPHSGALRLLTPLLRRQRTSSHRQVQNERRTGMSLSETRMPGAGYLAPPPAMWYAVLARELLCRTSGTAQAYGVHSASLWANKNSAWLAQTSFNPASAGH
jgi:hypothetical protein